ncbi:MAG: single-stranded DNA-binding protein [Anaerolinea sp.]|nr:single-stranded DNA-binding protein [Anaerolinea sp.]
MFEQTIIIGNLGNDPDLRYTSAGIPVCTMSVAVNRKWTNADGTPGEETKWFRATAWRKLAETCNQYLSKGRQVMVIGRVAASAFSGQDGSPRASLEVTADSVRFLGGGRGEAAPGAPAGNGNGASAHIAPMEEEDIPF